MTLFTTILAGVSVFVIGQIFLKWMIEPIQELRKIIAEVLYCFANDYSYIQNALLGYPGNVVTQDKNAFPISDKLKHLGSSLLSSQKLIPFYENTSKVFRSLPESKNIELASSLLSKISIYMFVDKPDKNLYLDLYQIRVCKALGFKNPIQIDMSEQELENAIKEYREIESAKL